MGRPEASQGLTVGTIQWYRRVIGGPGDPRTQRVQSEKMGSNDIGNGNNTKEVHSTFKHKVNNIKNIQSINYKLNG